jgi:hypothetical protein
MPFAVRPYLRFPVVLCTVTYHSDLFLKLPLTNFSGLGLVQSVEGGLILRWKEISILSGTS